MIKEHLKRQTSRGWSQGEDGTGGEMGYWNFNGDKVHCRTNDPVSSMREVASRDILDILERVGTPDHGAFHRSILNLNLICHFRPIGKNVPSCGRLWVV